jgi:tRNA threonylcarbamoyladenosine biosynthesis protein TsaB
MLLLAIDTSGKNGGIALAEVTSGRPEIEPVAAVALAGGTFSAQLIPQISELLTRGGFQKSDLAAFAVATGPGSFTGLRVGLAAVKALAEVLQKPVAAVSLLEAIARSGSLRGRVVAALDAGRGEVYCGDCEIENTEAVVNSRIDSEVLVSREQFLVKASMKHVVTPDTVLAELAHAAGIPCEQIHFPDANVIARLGWEHIERGQTVRPEELEANYIRRSDAEVFSKPGS